MRTKTQTLTLRVSPDFKRRLARLAAVENRSQTNLLEQLVYERTGRRPTSGSREPTRARGQGRSSRGGE
jgi:predicted transcriptional regulator